MVSINLRRLSTSPNSTEQVSTEISDTTKHYWGHTHSVIPVEVQQPLYVWNTIVRVRIILYYNNNNIIIII